MFERSKARSGWHFKFQAKLQQPCGASLKGNLLKGNALHAYST